MKAMFRMMLIVFPALMLATQHSSAEEAYGIAIQFRPDAKQEKFVIGTFASAESVRRVQPLVFVAQRNKGFHLSGSQSLREHTGLAIAAVVLAGWGIAEAIDDDDPVVDDPRQCIPENPAPCE